MPKNNRHGKAAVISNEDYSKIRKQIKSPKYKLLLDLAWYTGERWGALCQLKITDLYSDGIPREYITFRAATRKASPTGERETRQIPVHTILYESLKAYQPEDNSEWMFPNGLGSHMSLRNADLILRSAVDKAGLSAKGISTHSTRRSFVTKLHKAGVDLYTIQAITGHRDFKALKQYVDIDVNRIQGAIAIL